MNLSPEGVVDILYLADLGDYLTIRDRGQDYAYGFFVKMGDGRVGTGGWRPVPVLHYSGCCLPYVGSLRGVEYLMKGITNQERDARATLLNDQKIGTFLTVANGNVGYLYVREDYTISPHLIWRLIDSDETRIIHTSSWQLLPLTVSGIWSLS